MWKPLRYVASLFKDVRLVDSGGESRHFNPPVTAGEISCLYPHHRVYDESGASVPSSAQLKTGKTYSLCRAPKTGARHWKPSLEAIAEEKVVLVKNKDEKPRSVKKSASDVGKTQAKKKIIKEKKESFRPKISPWSITPSFAPSPFLF